MYPTLSIGKVQSIQRLLQWFIVKLNRKESSDVELFFYEMFFHKNDHFWKFCFLIFYLFNSVGRTLGPILKRKLPVDLSILIGWKNWAANQIALNEVAQFFGSNFLFIGSGQSVLINGSDINDAPFGCPNQWSNRSANLATVNTSKWHQNLEKLFG